jgi:hypothetical protein
LETGSFYPITSSWSVSASWASVSGESISASYALTASYALNGGSSGLSIPSYDYSNIIYSGPNGQIGSCTYKIGGISGSIVAVVTAIYDGNLFIGVSKSLA